MKNVAWHARSPSVYTYIAVLSFGCCIAEPKLFVRRRPNDTSLADSIFGHTEGHPSLMLDSADVDQKLIKKLSTFVRQLQSQNTKLQSDIKSLNFDFKALKKRTQLERQKMKELESKLAKCQRGTTVQRLQGQDESKPKVVSKAKPTKDKPWYQIRAEKQKNFDWYSKHIPVPPDKRIPFLGERFGPLCDDKRLPKDHDHMLFMGESPDIADGDFESCKTVDFVFVPKDKKGERCMALIRTQDSWSREGYMVSGMSSGAMRPIADHLITCIRPLND
jgi:hypothetical protein